jgi:5'-nucleotidase
MRYIALCALVAIGAAMFGCQKQEPPAVASEPPIQPAQEPVVIDTMPPVGPAAGMPGGTTGGYTMPPAGTTAKPIPPAPRPVVTVPPKPAATPRTYTVKAGDTFIQIARSVYGDASKYKAIVAANPQVKDPDKDLRPGMVINLPE